MESDNQALSDQATTTQTADSLWVRALPPALIALAWALSDVTLVPECDSLKGWKVIGLAAPVFWLASIGPSWFSRYRRWSFGLAAALLALGLAAGWGVENCSVAVTYLVKLLYASMHVCITASLGILVFLALIEPQNKNVKGGTNA